MCFGQVNPSAQLNTFQNLIPSQYQAENSSSRQNEIVPKLIAYTNHYYGIGSPFIGIFLNSGLYSCGYQENLIQL